MSALINKQILQLICILKRVGLFFSCCNFSVLSAGWLTGESHTTDAAGTSRSRQCLQRIIIKIRGHHLACSAAALLFHTVLSVCIGCAPKAEILCNLIQFAEATEIKISGEHCCSRKSGSTASPSELELWQIRFNERNSAENVCCSNDIPAAAATALTEE